MGPYYSPIFVGQQRTAFLSFLEWQAQSRIAQVTQLGTFELLNFHCENVLALPVLSAWQLETSRRLLCLFVYGFCGVWCWRCHFWLYFAGQGLIPFFHRVCVNRMPKKDIRSWRCVVSMTISMLWVWGRFEAEIRCKNMFPILLSSRDQGSCAAQNPHVPMYIPFFALRFTPLAGARDRS